MLIAVRALFLASDAVDATYPAIDGPPGVHLVPDASLPLVALAKERPHVERPRPHRPFVSPALTATTSLRLVLVPFFAVFSVALTGMVLPARFVSLRIAELFLVEAVAVWLLLFFALVFLVELAQPCEQLGGLHSLRRFWRRSVVSSCTVRVCGCRRVSYNGLSNNRRR